MADPMPTLLVRIDAALAAAFGPPPRWLYPDPVDVLVLALLSARTRDEVAMAALRVLRVRFPRWQDLLDADPAVVERLVGRTTWPDRKTLNLQEALRALQAARGRLELDFLAGLGVEDAIAWLRQLPGVGPKTASCVLLFSRLRMRALPVSTRHHRIAKRLGLISRRADAEAAHEPLLAMLPPDWDNDRIERHHWLIARLGRDHCTDRRPRCGDCPVRELCPSRGRIRPAPARHARQLALPFPAEAERHGGTIRPRPVPAWQRPGQLSWTGRGGPAGAKPACRVVPGSSDEKQNLSAGPKSSMRISETPPI